MGLLFYEMSLINEKISLDSMVDGNILVVPDFALRGANIKWQRVMPLRRSEEEIEASYALARALDEINRSKYAAKDIDVFGRRSKTTKLLFNDLMLSQRIDIFKRIIARKCGSDFRKFFKFYYKLTNYKFETHEWSEWDENIPKRRIFAVAARQIYLDVYRPAKEKYFRKLQNKINFKESRDKLKLGNRYSVLFPGDSSDEDPVYISEDEDDFVVFKKTKKAIITIVDDESWYDPQPTNFKDNDYRVVHRCRFNYSPFKQREFRNKFLNMLATKFSCHRSYTPHYFVHSPRPIASLLGDTSKFYIDDSSGQFITMLKEYSQGDTRIADHQMDTAHSQGDAQVLCKQQGNVVFMDETAPSKAKPRKRVRKRVQKVSHADLSFDIPAASRREIIIDNFMWGNKDRSTLLKSYTFPACILKFAESSPNAIPMLMSTYMHSDLQINIRVNSNKFQVGSLQCAWLYDPDADANIKNRVNIYCLSQTNHVLINAGSSNVGTLDVPYISTYSALNVFQSESNNRCLTLGKLYIHVLNKLTCPDSVDKEAEVIVSVSLRDAQFYGQRNRLLGKFAYPEMEAVGAAALLAGAERLLVNTNDRDRDNPPYQGASMKMVPQSNQSFSLGDKLVEPINSLRLDATGQHMRCISGPDEMSVASVVSTYGLMEKLEWSTNHTSGTLLATFDASPLQQTSKYSGFKVKSDDFYYLPPVAVVSGLFAYWSGELKLRLDVIASQFHTGRLMICYVPLYLEKITYQDAKSYPSQYLDLRELQQFVFNIPYIANVPCYPRRIGYTSPTDSYSPPGKVHIFVCTKLVAMDNISKTIDINVYMAGGSSFQVFVPAQPSIATCFYAADDKPSNKVCALPGSYPWYFGNDNIFVDDLEHEHAIIRYSTFWNALANFQNLKSEKYYVMSNDSKKLNKDKIVQFVEGSFSLANIFYVPVVYDAELGLLGMAACRTVEDCKSYWKEGYLGAGRRVLLTVMDFSSSPYCVENPEFDEFPITLGDFDVIHQMDERSTIAPSTSNVPDCRVYPLDQLEGRGVFGEKFDSLKILCRRYQAYGLTKGKITGNYGDVMCSVPVIPQGLDINLASIDEKKVWGRIRDGHIPIVLSGYRFFSGGIRFAMVSSSGNRTYWVQHRPEYEGPAVINIPPGVAADSLINSGYALYLQSAFVNNVLHFEVPYYKNRLCTYLQRPADDYAPILGANHLGQLYIGAEGGKKDDVSVCSFFYSLADDAEAHVFQGFPAMLFLDKIQPLKSLSAVRSQVKKMANHEIDLNVKLPSEVTDSLDKLSTALSQVPSSLLELKTSTTSIVSDLIGHLGHVMINPTVPHISWGLLNLLYKFNLINLDNSPQYASVISRFVSVSYPIAGHATQPNDLASSNAAGNDAQSLAMGIPFSDEVRNKIHSCFLTAEHQTSIDLFDCCSEFVSTLFILVSTVLNFKCSIKRGFRGSFECISELLNTIRKGSRDHFYVSKFFTAIITLLQKLFELVGIYKHPERVFENILNSEQPLISEWFVNVRRLIDIKNEEMIFAQDSAWAEEMEEAYVMGITISKSFLQFYEQCDSERKKSLASPYQIFKDTFMELNVKRNDMLRRGKSSIARREPFCVYVFGPPGCGKSQMVQSMIPDLLDKQGISYVGESTFTLSSGSDYWNGCRNQPCILFDDWLSVDSGSCKENDLKAFTSVKTCAVLNPPQAAIEDKQQRYCPELMMVLSNDGYPAPIGAVKEVLWRRRDVLIEVEMIDDLKSFANMVDQKEPLHKRIEELDLNTSYPLFEHLQFRYKLQPSSNTSRSSSWMNYQAILKYINKQHTLFRQNQQQLFNMRKLQYEKHIVITNDDFTPNLKVRMAEYRRAAEFLRTHNPAENVSYWDLLSIASEFSKTGVITPEMGSKIVLMKHALIVNHQMDSEEIAMGCKCAEVILDAVYDVDLEAFKFEDLVVPKFGCGVYSCPLTSPVTRNALFRRWMNLNPALVSARMIPPECLTLVEKSSLFFDQIAQYFKEFYNSSYSLFSESVCPWLYKLLKGLSKLIILMSVAGGLYMLLRCVMGMFLPPMAADVSAIVGLGSVVHQGNYATEKSAQVRSINGPKPTLRQVGNFQMGQILSSLDSLKRKIFSNTYFIISPNGVSARFTIIHNNRAIFLKHYLEQFNKDFCLVGWKIKNCQSQLEISVRPSNWKTITTPESSIGYVEIDELPPHKSLLKSLIAHNSHSQGVSSCQIICPLESSMEIVEVRPKANDYLYIKPYKDMKAQELSFCYEYKWSGPGRCGSFLVDPNRNPSILGIHVAGSGEDGYSEPISREMFASWEEKVVLEPAQEVVVHQEFVSSLQGEYIPIGKVAPYFVHHEIGLTSEIPSQIHGQIFPVTTAPNPLKKNDPRMPEGYSPLYSGVANMLTPPLSFKREDVEEASAFFRQEMLTKVRPALSTCKVRSIEVAVNGLEGQRFYDALKLNTSEGFPYKFYRPQGAHDKNWLFSRDSKGVVEAINPDLVCSINRELNLRSEGNVVPTIFIDNVKDARLPHDKVLVPGKSRIFSISPVQFSIAFRMYFMDFLAAYRENRLNLSHAIGIAPDGPEWAKLVQFLNRPTHWGKQKGDSLKFFSGDYKNFGPTLSHQILKEVRDIIVSWCDQFYTDSTPTDHRIRECLLDEIIFSKHLCRDFVYQPLCGAPSGSPCTVELNSMVNDFYLFIAFKYLVRLRDPDHPLPPDYFSAQFRYCTYGDDVICAIDSSLAESFNNVTLSKFFRSYGIGYTDASKKENYIPYHDSLKDLTFLKRGFIIHPNLPTQFLAPLDLDVSVKEVVNWRSDRIDPLEGLQASLQGCLANAFSHGPIIYHQIYEQLLPVKIKYQLPEYLRTWEDWNRIHFKNFYL